MSERSNADRKQNTEALSLSAGSLTLSYDNGWLRYFRLAGKEVLRAVYVALRDPAWHTIPFDISDLSIHDRGDSFDISFLATHLAEGYNFVWQALINGSANGSVRYVMEGMARSGFLKSRIGICVLHPVDPLAGTRCMVETLDGKQVEGVFPVQIAPHQPFKNIAAIEHAAGDLRLRMSFSGDIFEMEDQRNWTDYSYKTYSTPLELPYPVRMEPGDEVRQTVQIDLLGDLPAVEPKQKDPAIRIDLGSEEVAPLPRIGLGYAGTTTALADWQTALLRSLNLSHLYLPLHLNIPSFGASLRSAAMEAGELNIPLLLGVCLSDDAEHELIILRDLITDIRPPLQMIHVFHQDETSTSEQWVRIAREILALNGGGYQFGAGTNFDFAEINRQHPPIVSLNQVTYAASPQVHATDNRSLVENLPGLGATAISARGFCGVLPLHVGPITLKPQLPIRDGFTMKMDAQSDPRQSSLFAAGWMVGALKFLGEAGVESLTIFETRGDRGIMSAPGLAGIQNENQSTFPVCWVLSCLAPFTDGRVIRTDASHPLLVQALTATSQRKRRSLIANLTEQSQRVELLNLPPRVRVRFLEHSAAGMEVLGAAETSDQVFKKGKSSLSLTFKPHAIACVDADWAENHRE